MITFSLCQADEFLFEAHSTALVVISSAASLTQKDFRLQLRRLSLNETSTVLGLRLLRSDVSVPAGAYIHAIWCGDRSRSEIQLAVQGSIAELEKREFCKVAYICPDEFTPEMVGWVVSSVGDGTYRYRLTKPTSSKSCISEVLVVVCDKSNCATEFATGMAICEAVEFAKDLANLPANHCTPSHLAEVAWAITAPNKVNCIVYGESEIRELGMNAYLAVAQGAVSEPKFIELRYEVGEKYPLYVLIGKGITFDSGGLTLKPAGGLDELKYDMCGAATVISTIRAISRLKIPVNVVALVPCCENMIGPGAIRPGDVVSTMSGHTVEIVNTDAEGRLLICDVLTYARRFKAEAVVVVATLTGACEIALGSVRSGLFTPFDQLADALLTAGEAANDLCWRMPLDDKYADGLTSAYADFSNFDSQIGGAVSAAKFIEKFTNGMKWAHLDVAGTAWTHGKSKAATGRPTELLIRFLVQQVNLPPNSL